jgi:hypothetical protein
METENRNNIKDYIDSESEKLENKLIVDPDLKKAIYGSLSGSISQIYTAREAFSSTIQSAFNQMLIFYTAGSALLLAIMTQEDVTKFNAFVIAILALLCFGAPENLSSKWRNKLDAGYDLYAAAILHACVLHKALGIDLSLHHWMKLMEECKQENGVFKSGYESNHEPTVFEPKTATDENTHRKILFASKHYIAVFKSRPRGLWSFYNYVFNQVTYVMTWVGIVFSVAALGSVLLQKISD